MDWRIGNMELLYPDGECLFVWKYRGRYPNLVDQYLCQDVSMAAALGRLTDDSARACLLGILEGLSG